MTDLLSRFEDNINVAVIGASGGIGSALVQKLEGYPKINNLYLFSRSRPDHVPDNAQFHEIDVTNEDSVQSCADQIDGKLHIVIGAIGILHEGDVHPEKSLRDINFSNFQHIFATNTFGPALVMKHFLPKMDRDIPTSFAFLSARVGSISDNEIGGWYAYRASKAALNMLIKNASIEVGRRNKKISIIGLHPGTVDTNLSKPFQGNVPEHKLFTAHYAAECLLNVINEKDETQTGLCFDWDGKAIEP
ncbi:MAG: SDR family NAD(P)-dependent oxidoreductase [Pseudomonadota bacterium]